VLCGSLGKEPGATFVAEPITSFASIATLTVALVLAGCGSGSAPVEAPAPPVEDPGVAPFAPVEPDPAGASSKPRLHPVEEPPTSAPGPGGPPAEAPPAAPSEPSAPTEYDPPSEVQAHGAFGAPTEPPSSASTLGSPGVPSPTPVPTQTRSEGATAAVIRAYLAQSFIYEWWYTRIREVMVRGRTAVVSSWHLGQTRPALTARTICRAILHSHRVDEVRVRYQSRHAVDCP
jgi:hypothetical protein